MRRIITYFFMILMLGALLQPIVVRAAEQTSIRTLLEENHKIVEEMWPKAVEQMKVFHSDLEGEFSDLCESAYYIRRLNVDFLIPAEQGKELEEYCSDYEMIFVPLTYQEKQMNIKLRLTADGQVSYMGYSEGKSTTNVYAITPEAIEKSLSAVAGVREIQYYVCEGIHTLFVSVQTDTDKYLIPYTSAIVHTEFENGKAYPEEELISILTEKYYHEHQTNPEEYTYGGSGEEFASNEPVRNRMLFSGIGIAAVILAVCGCIAVKLRKKR